MALTINSVFNHQDMWGLIYQYDTTYRDIFKGCLDDLKWIEIINKIQFDRYTGIQLCGMKQLQPSTDLLTGLMKQNMKTILPHLERVGFKASDFMKENCFWHIEYRQHTKSNERVLNKVKAWWANTVKNVDKKQLKNVLQNQFPELYWKGTIRVELLVGDVSLETSDWINEFMDQNVRPYQYESDEDDEDDVSDYTYDSHGRYRINHRPPPSHYYPQIYKSGNCDIHAILLGEQIYKVICEFKGVKIPARFDVSSN